MNFIFRYLFKIFGWKLVGNVPSDVKKAIFAVCPHWYSKDFYVGLGTRATLNLRIGYLAKAELFKPPFGFIFKYLDGIPVYRTESRNLVESSIDSVQKAENMMICIAPEGTRKDVEKLKSGFYYIALGAQIPIIRVGFDYENKCVHIGEPFFVSGNFKEDMQTYFVPFFEKVGGKKKSWVNNYRNNIF